MSNENESLDTLNTEETELDENIELTALKEKYQEISSKNKHLFERAKKAEGEIKEMKALKEQLEKKPEAKPDKSDEFGLLQKTYLRAANIVAEDEVELAKDLQKKTGLDWDKLVDDDYFKSKLEGLRTAKANAAATSNIPRGGSGDSGAKDDPNFWAGKIGPDGAIPEGMPKHLIAGAFEIAAAKTKSGGKTFYND